MAGTWFDSSVTSGLLRSRSGAALRAQHPPESCSATTLRDAQQQTAREAQKQHEAMLEKHKAPIANQEVILPLGFVTLSPREATLLNSLAQETTRTSPVPVGRRKTHRAGREIRPQQRCTLKAIQYSRLGKTSFAFPRRMRCR